MVDYRTHLINKGLLVPADHAPELLDRRLEESLADAPCFALTASPSRPTTIEGRRECGELRQLERAVGYVEHWRARKRG